MTDAFNQLGYYLGADLAPMKKEFPAAATFEGWLWRSGWQVGPFRLSLPVELACLRRDRRQLPRQQNPLELLVLVRGNVRIPCFKGSNCSRMWLR